jgi:hypothetical protein
MKQFVMALNKEGSCFEHIVHKSPEITMEKLKAGIFDGIQIRQLMNDPLFIPSMNEIESCAWSSFVLVTKNFLGNKKADNYAQLVEDMLLHFNKLGCNMSIKVQRILVTSAKSKVKDFTKTSKQWKIFVKEDGMHT